VTAPCSFPVAVAHLIAAYFHKYKGVIIVIKSNGYCAIYVAFKEKEIDQVIKFPIASSKKPVSCTAKSSMTNSKPTGPFLGKLFNRAT